MPDVESWYEGAEVVAKAEHALRAGRDPLPDRVQAASTVLHRAEESHFPVWLWPQIRELRARGASRMLSEDEALEFVDALVIIRTQLDQELTGESKEFLSCPRCRLRLVPGTLRVGGGLVARLVGKAVLSIRFQPEGNGHTERRMHALDNLDALVCPVCHIVVLDENLEP